MSVIRAEHLDLLRRAASSHQDQFELDVAQPLSKILQLSHPREIREIMEGYEHFYDAIGELPINGPYILDDRWDAFIKRLILDRRRSTAAHVESQRAKTHHAELIAKAEAELRPYDQLMELDWFKRAVPIRMPRLADFVSLEYALSKFHETYPVPEKVFDEKFHILQAPQSFWADIAYYRAMGELRGVPITIAYLDIDNFKSFNTEYTETVVDREILPRFMRAIDSTCFARGSGYRFGGDEYVLLLPNLNRLESTTFLKLLKSQLAALQYPGVTRSTTVSVGFCFAEPDCFLTDGECLSKANVAKQHAKSNGKNCVSSFSVEDFSELSLRLV